MNTSKISFIFVCISLFIYPYVFWIIYFYNTPEIFGKNIIIVFITIIFIISFFLNLDKIYNNSEKLKIVLFILIISFILFLRSYIYRESFINDFLISRYNILYFFYFGLFNYLTKNSNNRVFYRIIFFNFIIQIIWGLIHHYFFPEIVTGIYLDEIRLNYIKEANPSFLIQNYNGLYHLPKGFGGYRENGSLISSNLYSNFILLSLLLIIFSKKNSRILKILLIPISIWIIYLTGSRFTIFFSVLLILYYIFINLKKKYFILSLLLVVAFSNLLFKNSINRTLREGSGRRIEKLIMGLNLINKENHMYLGAPLKIINNVEINKIGISDNSYMEVLLMFGVFIGSLIIIVFIFYLLRISKLRKYNIILSIYLVLLFCITNAIYWDIFIVYFTIVFFLLRNEVNKV